MFGQRRRILLSGTIDIIKVLINTFIARVSSDGGKFEGSSNCYNILSAMKSYYLSFSLLVTANSFKASKVYALIPTAIVSDLTHTRSSTARRVNANGLIETMAANTPRIDWTYGYPMMLNETSGTNNCVRSEDFTNATWLKSSGGNLATVTGDTTIAPDGNTTADTITFSGSAGNSYVAQSIGALAVVNGSKATISVFAKTNVQVLVHGGGGANGADGAYQYQYIGNGWYRQWITRTYSASGSPQIVLVNTYVGNVAIQVWGAQVEIGAYLSSYIPTVASTVTRTTDSSNTTGLSSLIGQSEGTIYAEFLVTQKSADWLITALSLTGNSITNGVLVSVNASGNIVVQVYAGGSTVISIVSASLTIGNIYKIAFAYKSGDSALYINGVQSGATNSTTFTLTTLDALSLVNTGYYVSGGQQLVKSVGLIKTRLPNLLLASLTT